MKNNLNKIRTLKTAITYNEIKLFKKVQISLAKYIIAR